MASAASSAAVWLPSSLYAPPDTAAVINIIMTDDIEAFTDCVLPAALRDPEAFSRQLQERDVHKRSLLQLLLTSKEWMEREYYGGAGSALPGGALWQGKG
jgi:hypothetical protein